MLALSFSASMQELPMQEVEHESKPNMINSSFTAFGRSGKI